MKFTKEQLYEIEKMFDYVAGSNLRESGRLLEQVKDCPPLRKILVESSVSYYNMCRTISAVARSLQDEK